MQLKKFLAAGALAALMAGATLGFAADLSNYPSPFVTGSGVDTLVVVGADAMPADVVGAVDVASRLGSEVKTTTTSTSTTTVSVDGRKEDIALENNLTQGAGTFPGRLKTSHVSALNEQKIAWEYQADGEISTHEELWLGDINFTRNPAPFNGSYYVDLPDPSSQTRQNGSSALSYRLVFDESMSLSQNLSATKTITATILGKNIAITGVPQNYQIKALSGEQLDVDFGTSATTADGYDISPTSFQSDSKWKLKISKDGQSEEKELTVGSSSDTLFTGLSPTVKARILDNFTRTTLVDGVETTVKVARVVVGANTEVVYDDGGTGAGTTTTGNNTFPSEGNEWKWFFSIANKANQFQKNDYIGVYYDPSPTTSEPLNISEGEAITLPNDIELKFAALNTNNFATVTVTREVSTLYTGVEGDTENQTSSAPMLKVETDGGSFVNGTTIDDKIAYIVYNDTAATNTGSNITLMLATKDRDGYIRNVTAPFSTNSTVGTQVFTLDYGDFSDALTFVARASNAGIAGRDDLLIIDKLGDQIQANFTMNVSASGSSRAMLGDANGDTADNADILVNGTGVATTYRDYWTVYGVGLEGLKSMAGSDKLVLKVPDQQLKATIAIGKNIAVGTTSTDSTAVTPIKTALGKLDTEVTSTERSTKNLILVGGPCVNDITKEILDSAKGWDVADSCAEWLDSTSTNYKPAGEAIIKYVADALVSGKAALIVAGTNADDTRSATTVLQSYDDNALTGAEVSVKGTTVTSVA